MADYGSPQQSPSSSYPYQTGGRYQAPASSAGLPTTEGDQQFYGINMEQDKSTLPSGMCSGAINKRFNTGRAETRKGTITPVWANIWSQFLAHQNAAILGSGLYNNPNRNEVILLALPTQVLMIKCGSYPTTIKIPDNVVLDGEIEFSQDFNRVFLEGSSTGTYVWDGVSDDGFVLQTRDNPADTTRAIVPDVAWSVNMGDRRIFPLSRDEIGVSDIGDYTDYDPILSVFRVNSGTADPIVGVYPYNQNYLLVGKKRSWDVLANFTGDLSTSSMAVLSSELGLAARKAVKMVGADLIFPYQTGVYRINQIIQNKLEVTAQPVASTQNGGRVVDPIAPLLRRINWNYADHMVAAVNAPYYYLAVPLDGSTWNNALLVYNTVSDQWEGYDTWATDFQMRIDNLIVTDYQGTPHVYVINKGTNSIHVLNEGHFDTSLYNDYEITDVLETRGYSTLGWNASTNRDAERFEIGLSTWRPDFTITQVSEQAGDERVIASGVTPDRTKYYQFGRVDYDPSNVNDDFSVAGREDYSVTLNDQPITLGSGINLDQQQEHTTRFALMSRSRWKGFKITSTQGRCDVTGCILVSAGVHKQDSRRGS